ncbi:hypothetical protein CROQUDRAFT_97013 [Cronartium quercuum f. sp. fusiforme G11]|uniref:Uncharacterized protein n=1 Tax=Cronartium quercuum f. sp. fusiforme G11 TaxID=708437 RepID=A0A9P6NEU7_9BASI|nr:hypothetical protein CROQUDRAFT_97013 [Cronartium quercuum f. sp. fusiforme G11]
MDHAQSDILSQPILEYVSKSFPIPSYGLLTYEDVLEYLERRPTLKEIDEDGISEPKFSLAQNFARQALRLVNLPSARTLLRCSGVGHNQYFNALIWLIGVAENKLSDWKAIAGCWRSHNRDIPPGRSRDVQFNPDAASVYSWCTKAGVHVGDAEDSDEAIERIAEYWYRLMYGYYQPFDSSP